jgi:hypothetical protein
VYDANELPPGMPVPYHAEHTTRLPTGSAATRPAQRHRPGEDACPTPARDWPPARAMPPGYVTAAPQRSQRAPHLRRAALARSVPGRQAKSQPSAGLMSVHGGRIPPTPPSAPMLVSCDAGRRRTESDDGLPAGAASPGGDGRGRRLSPGSADRAPCPTVAESTSNLAQPAPDSRRELELGIPLNCGTGLCGEVHPAEPSRGCTLGTIVRGPPLSGWSGAWVVPRRAARIRRRRTTEPRQHRI